MTKNEHTILVSLGTLLLLSYAVAGFFCHPSADDFTYALLGKNDDFLTTVLNERYRWNGRYFSNFLVLFSPLNWGGLMAYKAMPLVLILFIFIGITSVFKHFVGTHYVLLSIVTTGITFSIMPDITEGIYWYTGAWTYLPGAVLFLYGLSLIFKFNGSLNGFQYLVLSILFTVASGFNEIIPLLGITTFLIAVVLNRNKKVYFIFLLLFILLLFYMVTAPGNAIRANHFDEKNQLFYSLYKSVAYTIRFIGEWLLNPAIYLWGILLLNMNFSTEKIKKWSFLQQPLIAFLLLVLPTFIACFGPIWSTGLLGQYRTVNLASFLFVISFTMLVIANKEQLIQKIKFKALVKYSFIVFTVFFMLWKNNFFLFKEFATGELVQFNEEMNQRYAVIKKCKESRCLVDEIKSQPNTLFVYPLVDDPKHWLNQSYQLYFESGEIVKR